MDKKILKLLNKNFDKTWARLSSEQQKECVDFMLGALKQECDFYDSAVKAYSYAQKVLNSFMTESEETFVENLKANMRLKLAKKIEKEKSLQEQIMSSNDKQLLFSNIYDTYVLLPVEFRQANTICDKVNKLMQFPIDATTLLSRSIVASAAAKVGILLEKVSDQQSFKNQAKKVRELFPQFTKSAENEPSM